MNDDKTARQAADPPKGRPGAAPDSPQQDLVSPDLDPATAGAEEDEEALLPEIVEEPADAVAEGPRYGSRRPRPASIAC